MRALMIMALALFGTAVHAERYELTALLISVQIPLSWHEDVRSTGEAFGEGCIIDVEDTFIISLEKIANTGLVEQLDPDVPFHVVEYAVFRGDQAILTFGGVSSIRSPGKVAYLLKEDTYEAIGDAIRVRLEAAGCFEK